MLLYPSSGRNGVGRGQRSVQLAGDVALEGSHDLLGRPALRAARDVARERPLAVAAELVDAAWATDWIAGLRRTGLLTNRDQAERIVQEDIERLMGSYTVIVIAHRLSTISKCDRVAVLGEGGVLEYGTHEELHAAGGLYRELHDLQFAPRQKALTTAGTAV